MKDKWWKKKEEEIQGYADLKNAKLFYFRFREVCGPPQRNTTPVRNLQGELLTGNEAINKDCQNILSSWSGHFKQLLNRPSSIDPSVIEEIWVRPQHVELDGPPMEYELREAVDELQCSKSAGPDGIPLEVFKAGG